MCDIAQGVPIQLGEVARRKGVRRADRQARAHKSLRDSDRGDQPAPCTQRWSRANCVPVDLASLKADLCSSGFGQKPYTAATLAEKVTGALESSFDSELGRYS